jgi:glycine cleavage system H protein
MGNIDMYATKGFEYLLILGFLSLFTVFYLYFTSDRFEKVTVAVTNRIADGLTDWFRVPDNILFHQAHTWARREESEPATVVVGMDDFAQKMAGPLELWDIPAVGATIKQGEKGWSLHDGEKSVDMLMPMSGEVVAVNNDVLIALGKNSHKDTELNDDPYGKGWILKVIPDDFERERKGLLSGTLARKWMEEVVEHLRSKMSPELGAVMQDGGVPVAGMAKNINAEEWDQLLKEFFLT